jgi:hypothetical protein
VVVSRFVASSISSPFFLVALVVVRVAYHLLGGALYPPIKVCNGRIAFFLMKYVLRHVHEKIYIMFRCIVKFIYLENPK